MSFFSDSLSCITALQNPYPVRHYLINRILLFFINPDSSKFSLEWIPSHMGIPGNENADLLAKQSLNLNSITKISLPLPEAYHLINHKIKSKWLNTQSVDTSATFFPRVDLIKHKSLSRKEQIVLSRFRMNACRFSHDHIFDRKERETCSNCGNILTIKHCILHCPIFETERRPIISLCHKMNLPFCLKTLFSNKIELTIIFPLFAKISSTLKV